MLSRGFFLTFCISLTLAAVPKPKFVNRLVSLQDPPILTPRFQNGPILTPRQSGSCSGVNFAFTATGQSATLQSLNYPYDYPLNQDCSYFISSPAGTTMTMSCDTFNVDCNDYMGISLSGSSTFSDAGYYCGRGQLPSQSTTGNKLSISFHSGNTRGNSYYYYRYNCNIVVSGSAAPAPAATTTPAPAPAPATTSSPAGSCTCGIRNVNGATRIVGGTQTKTGEFPWRVAVFIADSSGYGHLCGGTIISPSWIMTAAHCTDGMKSTDTIWIYTEAQANPVTVGGGVRYKADRYVQHPNYNSNTMDNDITLVHLPNPLTFKSNVSPVCLPFKLTTKNFSGESVFASGWGTTKPVPVNTENNDPSSTTLMEVILPLKTTEECAKIQQGITNNMICTYKPGYDTCQGDSGGSIDYQDANGRLNAVGVVSYGYGCAQTNYPGVYTKVINYLPWIQSTAAGETFCNP